MTRKKGDSILELAYGTENCCKFVLFSLFMFLINFFFFFCVCVLKYIVSFSYLILWVTFSLQYICFMGIQEKLHDNYLTWCFLLSF